MPERDGKPPSRPPDDRSHRAGLWELDADEAERLADERENLADERDALADERERLADRREHSLDVRESGTASREASREVAAAQATLRRAEDGLRRADEALVRAQQGTARALARAARREASAERVRDAASAATLGDHDEQDWAADRRDFVAADRTNLAVDRERTADQRDEAADLRERTADARERDALAREHGLDRRHGNGQATSPDPPGAASEITAPDDRALARARREQAAAGRRAAARHRAEVADEWGPQAYGPRLLASFAELAQHLFGSDDTADVLPRVLTYAVEAVAACDWASITLTRPGAASDTIASDPIAAELDDLQMRAWIGPTHEALEAARPVMDPLLSESRWPELATTARTLGVESCLAHALVVGQSTGRQPLGVFTMYSAIPAAFTAEEHDFSDILAAYVTTAVTMARQRDELDRREAALHRALSTRDIIGQAKGILMERQHMSAGDAFDLLRRASQRLNRRLADVAEHLASTGELPE